MTECFVLDEELRAVRGLLRSREAQIKPLHQSKMRGIHFLHAHGHCYTTGSYWTKKFKTWIHQIEVERSHDEFVLRGHLNDIDDHQGRIQEIEQQVQTISESETFQQAVQILQGFRGIGLISAMQLVWKIGDVRRFESPTAWMAYLGFVPSQHSSGNTIRTGSITKTGNTHARKVLVSAAWKYTYAPRIRVALQERQKHCSAKVIAISQKTQTRLYKRSHARSKRKPPKVAVVAIARELVGFLWESLQLPVETA